MLKTLIAAVTASVIATATPALAEDHAKPAAPIAAPVAAVRTVVYAAPAANPRQRYCLVETMTGSRLPTRTCQTRAEWLQSGFDPLAK